MVLNGIITIDIIVLLLHLIFPAVTWRDGRNLYFNYSGEFTLPSWVGGRKFLLLSFLALIILYREFSIHSKQDTKASWG